MSKALKIIWICTWGFAVLALLSFVGSMHSSASCEDVLVVDMTKSDENLISDDEVLNAIGAVDNPIMGSPLNQIDTRSIEELVEAMPYAKSVTAYKTIDRRVVVELVERKLISRLIDKNGVSAYMDSEGYILPKKRNVNSRLPVVTGDFIIDPIRLESGYVAGNEDQNSNKLRSVFLFSAELEKSNFWKSQLQQTELSKDGDFVSIPQVGNHEIIFGSVENIGEKLDKLKLFYADGMNGSRWNKYRIINLKYKDQVVCTKK